MRGIKVLGGTKLIIQQTKAATIEILGHKNLMFIIKQIDSNEKQEVLIKKEELLRSKKALYNSIDDDEYPNKRDLFGGLFFH